MVTATPAVGQALTSLDQWLETMRGPAGYGGPVAHWWRDSVLFCGPGLDWRYEGIITGYLELSAKTGDSVWLAKARRAGDDLVAGQLPDGNYRNSGFEANPSTGGTPHEAACDLALLRLAAVLRARREADWETYFRTAARNIEQHSIKKLWDADAQVFRDDPSQPSFVPNKAATLVEALFLLSEISGRDEYIERYARPTLLGILAHQVRAAGDPCDGAIAQNSFGRQTVQKYFPYYNARCVPALTRGYQTLGWAACLDAAHAAMAFVLRWRDGDGGFPQVVYPGGRVNRYPRWVAATGDILGAMACLQPFGLEPAPEPTLGWLLDGQLPSGAVRTAEGFASQVSQGRPPSVPDWRDLLPVVGWCDKAFRYLATVGLPTGERHEATPVDVGCTFHGRPARYHEDAETIVVVAETRQVYGWRKGATWAEVPGLIAPSP